MRKSFEEIYVHYGHLVIRATVLDMAGPMCIIKVQGRVAPAWLTGDKWVIYHQPFDILDDPRMSEPAHSDDPYDGVLWWIRGNGQPLLLLIPPS